MNQRLVQGGQHNKVVMTTDSHITFQNKDMIAIPRTGSTDPLIVKVTGGA